MKMVDGTYFMPAIPIPGPLPKLSIFGKVPPVGDGVPPEPPAGR